MIRRGATVVANGLPATALAAAIAVLGWSVPRIVEQATWNSDTVTAMVLADSMRQGGQQGKVTVFQAAYLWLDRLVASFPGHRVLWLAIPLVCVAVTVVVIGLVAAGVGGRGAGVAAAAMVLAGGPAVALAFLTPQFHGLAWMLTAACGAAAVLFASGRVTGRRALVLAALVAIVAGAGAASDVILVVTGIVPLALSGLACAWRRGAAGRHAAEACVATAGAAVVVLGAVQLVMHAALYSSGLPGGSQRTVVSAAELAGHAQLLGRGALDIAGGLTLTSWSSAAIVAIGIAVLTAAVIGVLVVGLRTASELVSSRGDASSAARAHVVFWIMSALLLVAAFLLSQVAGGSAGLPPSQRILASERYLAPLLLAAAALLPLWPRRLLTRAAFALGVALFAGLNLTATLRATDETLFQPGYTTAVAGVLTALQQHGLHRGYASYWLADALTWKADGSVTVFPVAQTADCGSTSPDPGLLCQMADGSMSGWYRPAAGPTFVVVEPDVDFVRMPLSTSLGTPSATYTVGRATIVVFPGDVAARFLPSCAGRADHAC